jgi:hypothetical protein
MHTMREKNGLSGFTSRFESDYDPFGAGHGCNSISAGLGSIYFPYVLSISCDSPTWKNLFLFSAFTCLYTNIYMHVSSNQNSIWMLVDLYIRMFSSFIKKTCVQLISATFEAFVFLVIYLYLFF